MLSIDLSKNKKICYVASSGGHWEELMCISPLFSEFNSVFITEEGGQASDSNLSPLYLVPQINRKEKLFFFHFISLFKKTLKIIKMEKPDYIVTTGALIAFPFCLVGKVFGAKIIYLESFARIYSGSLTGKLCYPLADYFLIQWESLQRKYPKAVYVGGIF